MMKDINWVKVKVNKNISIKHNTMNYNSLLLEVYDELSVDANLQLLSQLPIFLEIF